jgi:2'-5' RNA ligase
MRLFTGIDLPPEIVKKLEALIEELRPAAAVKWSPPGNLHITTKFVGEWPEERLGEIKRSLDSLPTRSPLNIAVQKLGFFPNPHAPQVFWAGVSGGDELAALAHDTENALATLGIVPEKRAFSAHLTLARISKTPVRQLLQAIAKLPVTDFGSFVADRFYLYQSRPGPTGSAYTRLAEFPLSK